LPPNYLRVVSRISRTNLGYPTGPNFFKRTFPKPGVP